MQCIETSNLSGKTKRIDVKFKYLPLYAKQKWVEVRKQMVAPLGSDEGAHSLASKKGKGMKSISFRTT